MRNKILTQYIRVRVSESDDQFLKVLLANTGLTISELLRQFIFNLQTHKSRNGKHKGFRS